MMKWLVGLVVFVISFAGLSIWGINKQVFFISKNININWTISNKEKELLRAFVQQTQGKNILVFTLEKSLVVTSFSVGPIDKKPVYYTAFDRGWGITEIKIYIDENEYKKYADKDRSEMLMMGILIQLKKLNKYSDDQYAKYTRHFYLSGWPVLITERKK